jgi:hypothetical protein
MKKIVYICIYVVFVHAFEYFISFYILDLILKVDVCHSINGECNVAVIVNWNVTIIGKLSMSKWLQKKKKRKQKDEILFLVSCVSTMALWKDGH